MPFRGGLVPDEADTADEVFQPPEDDELDLMPETIAMHVARAVRSADYSRHNPRYVPETPPRRKKTTEDVLDYIEYFASSDMVNDSVTRLYGREREKQLRKQSPSPRRTPFLRSRSGHLCSDMTPTKKRQASSAPQSPVHTPRPSKILTPDEAAKVGERLLGNARYKEDRIRALVQKKEEDEKKLLPPSRRLTKAQLADLGKRLCDNHKKKMLETTRREMVKRCEETPYCADTIQRYLLLRGLDSADKQLIPETKERWEGGPWRRCSWMPAGRSSSVQRETVEDKEVLTGRANVQHAPKLLGLKKRLCLDELPLRPTVSMKNKQQQKKVETSPRWR